MSEDHPGSFGENDAEMPIRFGLGTLLVFTVIVSAALAVLVVLPEFISVPVTICLAVVVPAVVLTVAIYGRGYFRTFCMGALFPMGLLLYTTGWVLGLSLVNPPGVGDLDSLASWLKFFDKFGGPYRIYTGCSWILAVLVGMACVVVRRLLNRANH